jgi:hypothetical protein
VLFFEEKVEEKLWHPPSSWSTRRRSRRWRAPTTSAPR